MSKAFGVVLVAAGLGVGSYALSPSYELNLFEWLDPIQTTIVTAPSVSKPADAAAKPAPEAPVPRPAFRPSRAEEKVAEASVPKPSSTPFSTVVQAPQRVKEAAPVRIPILPQRAAQVPGDRVSLARELQKELRRAGCYEGEITGAWTPSTRKAMKAFADRANASLPVDEPDYILLSLVQSNPDNFCGKSCPSGQGLAEDGRCLPNAILAQAAKKAAMASAQAQKAAPAHEKPAAIVGWSTTTTATAPAAAPAAGGLPPEGRMALAGPQAEAEADKPGATHVPPSARGWSPPAAYDRRPPPPRYVQRSRDVPSFFRSLDRYSP